MRLQSVMKIKTTSLILAFTLLLCAFVSCGKSSAVMTYKDAEMSVPKYSYWFSTLKTQLLKTYNAGIDNDDFWDSKTADGISYDELLTDSINAQIAGILVSTALFDEYGLTLDEDTVAGIDSDIAEKEDYIGSRSEMNKELGELGLNVDTLREVYIDSAKVSALRDYLYGTNGIKAPTDDELAIYFSENYRTVKMVIVYTGAIVVTGEDGKPAYDDSGNIQTQKLTDDEKAVKAELVDTIIDAINSGADIDDCIAEFSEVDYTEYPNGFFISKDGSASYGSDVVSAAWDMEIGETRKVSDDAMTFILYRTDMPDYSTLTENELSLISDMKDNLINKLINDMAEPMVKEVSVNKDLTADFDIREAHKNSYY